MFRRIKTALGGAKIQSKMEQAKSYNLVDKPFTQALLLRAGKYRDDAECDFKKMTGRTKPFAQDKTLDEFAANCVIAIVRHITTEALKNIGLKVAFLPYDPVPRYAHMAVAFSLFVLSGIHAPMEEEGIDLDFRELAEDIANLSFMFHPDKERAEHALEAIETFRDAVKAGGDNVKKWSDNLMRLIPIYILQWTTEKSEHREVDCIPLFGSMLSSLLKAVE